MKILLADSNHSILQETLESSGFLCDSFWDKSKEELIDLLPHYDAVICYFGNLLPNTNKTMQKGTVKFFNETKGFGFIIDSSTKEEIFVHVTGLVDKIRENDVVTYEPARGKKGMNAVNVRLS